MSGSVRGQGCPITPASARRDRRSLSQRSLTCTTGTIPLHFPKYADFLVSVVHHQHRSLHRNRIKQLLNQLLLLRPWIGKKQANFGDVDLHAVVAKWPPVLVVAIVVAQRLWRHQCCSVNSRGRIIALGKYTGAENLHRNPQSPSYR